MGLLDLILGKKEQIGVGIDIGSTAVKIAVTELDREGKYTLLDVVEAPLPPKAVEKGEIHDPKEVVKTLKSIKNRLPRGRVCFTFSPYKSTIFSFTAPRDAKNIDAMVERELKKRIPVSMSELAVDYTRIEYSSKESIVTVVVGKKKAIEESVNLIGDAGIHVDSLTSTYVTIANVALLCYPELADSQGALVIDMGYSITSCICIKGGAVTHGGYIENGVKTLEEAAASMQGTGWEEVRRALIEKKLPDEVKEPAILSFIEKVAPEIDAYLTMCQSESPIKCTSLSVLGCGGGMDIPDLPQEMGFSLSSPHTVEVLDVTRELRVHLNALEMLKASGAARMIPAIGASLI